MGIFFFFCFFLFFLLLLFLGGGVESLRFSQHFSVMWGGFPRLNQYKAMKIKCLAQRKDTTPWPW